jgi:hypothetical protein
VVAVVAKQTTANVSTLTSAANKAAAAVVTEVKKLK